MIRVLPMLIAIFGLAVTVGALADARVESGPNGYNDKGDNFFHVPYDAANTYNESYLSNGDIAVIVSDGGDTADAAARHVQCCVDPNMMPDDLRQSANDQIRVTAGDTGETCTIEANGTTYESDTWAAVTQRRGNEITFVINCYDGAAVGGE